MASSFPQFPELPKELQVMIWEAAAVSAASRQQVIQGLIEPTNLQSAIPRVSNRGHLPENRDSPMAPTFGFPYAAAHVSPPAVLSACRLSRQIALRHKRFTSLQTRIGDEEETPVWFDFTSDVVILPTIRATSYGILVDWQRVGNKCDFERVQHVAVPWAIFHTGNRRFQTERERDQWWAAMFRQIYDLFPRLTDMYLFVPAERPGRGLPEPGVHFLEDGRHVTYRPILEPIVDSFSTMRLPPCHCEEKPASLAAALEQIEENLRGYMRCYGLQSRPQWSLDGDSKDSDKAPAPFRVHGRVFRRQMGV